MVAALLLPFVAHSVSLAASSQAIGYRTLLPLSGLFLVLAMFGLRAIAARHRVPRTVEAGVLAASLVVLALLAQRNPLALIAEPQGHEWELVQAAASRVRLTSDTQIYLIRPTIDYRSTERVYADEYGTLTADADWAAKEMFKAAMRERFPSGLPENTAYTLWTGSGPAAGGVLVRSRRRSTRAQELGRASAGRDHRFATLTACVADAVS